MNGERTNEILPPAEVCNTVERATISQPGSLTMPPPHEGSFASFQEAREALNLHTKQFGYALVIFKSQKYRGQIHRVYFGCSKGDNNGKKSVPLELKMRNTSSVKCQCPMRLWLIADDKNDIEGSWSIKHVKDEGSDYHNHKPDDLSALAYFRRLQRDPQMTSFVENAIVANNEPTQVLILLKQQYPDLIQKPRDISNLKQKQKALHVGAHTIAEATLTRLRDAGFFSRTVLNEKHQITNLFMSHPASVDLLKCYPDLMFLDCTYKTNKYRVPVLNIVGTTSTNRSYQIAMVWLESEDKANYVWALESLKSLLHEHSIPLPRAFVTDRDRACLNALDEVFPNVSGLICAWHRNKDVLAYARSRGWQQIKVPGIEIWEDDEELKKWMQVYHQAVNADTEEAWMERCSTLHSLWPEGASYLEREWWPYKERCVAHWTNKIRHFGNLATSRVEGSHAKVKRWLGNARCDLWTFVDKLIPLWLEMHRLAKQDLADEKTKILRSTQTDFYAPCQRRITRYALGKCLLELREAEREILVNRKKVEAQEMSEADITYEPCRGIFRTIFGIPCRHELREFKLNNISLEPKHFDKHWHVHQENLADCDPPVQNPPIQPKVNFARKQGWKNMKGTGVTGNKREMLASEHIDRNNTGGNSREMKRAKTNRHQTASRPQQKRAEPMVSQDSNKEANQAEMLLQSQQALIRMLQTMITKEA